MLPAKKPKMPMPKVVRQAAGAKAAGVKRSVVPPQRFSLGFIMRTPHGSCGCGGG